MERDFGVNGVGSIFCCSEYRNLLPLSPALYPGLDLSALRKIRMFSRNIISAGEIFYALPEGTRSRNRSRLLSLFNEPEEVYTKSKYPEIKISCAITDPLQHPINDTHYERNLGTRGGVQDISLC